MARIYLASSWKNILQPMLVSDLEYWGHQVYDFKKHSAMSAGGPVSTAFSWHEIDEDWETWTPNVYRTMLTTTPRASQGYLGDFRGMEWADTCVLLLPCGRSAHLEAGYMKGRGKRLIILMETPEPPDLMYLLADHICINNHELRDIL